MLPSLQDPTILGAITAGVAGLLLLVHARLQAQLLRQRIATGEGSAVIDAPTGLFAAATLQQCVRAEANRAARLGRQLDIWVTRCDDLVGPDGAARALAFDLAAGSTGIRLDDVHVCVLSCVGPEASPATRRPDLAWQHRCLEPDETTSSSAMAFLAEAAHA